MLFLRNHFESGDTRESIPNRIVSVAKPYVRPIVRGKEVKNVEFGAKCNNIHVDGISFIEKLSFNPFNEGTCLKHCVKMHKRLFDVSVMKLGGDTGYASEENRNYCKEIGHGDCMHLLWHTCCKPGQIGGTAGRKQQTLADVGWAKKLKYC